MRVIRLNILWYVTLLHAVWGISLLRSDDPTKTTPIALMSVLIPTHILLGIILLIIAALASIGLCISRKTYWRLLLLLPQQFFISLSAIGGLLAAARGQYADGTVKSSAHIFVDQLPIILAATFYIVALLTEKYNGHANDD